MEAIGIRDNGDAVGVHEAAVGNDAVVGGGDVRRVRFVDERGVDLGSVEDRGGGDDLNRSDPDYMQEEEEEQEEGQEEEEEAVGGEGREEVARILSERFLAGLEKGVEYRSVDEDERLDDLDQLSKDEVRESPFKCWPSYLSPFCCTLKTS